MATEPGMSGCDLIRRTLDEMRHLYEYTDELAKSKPDTKLDLIVVVTPGYTKTQRH
jgi:hypothetical protein